MNKCSSYHTQNKRKWIYDVYSGNCMGWEDIIVGICWGTKECEECYCEGDRSKCDFYDYIKEDAKKEKLEFKIQEAINFLKNNGYEVKKNEN